MAVDAAALPAPAAFPAAVSPPTFGAVTTGAGVPVLVPPMDVPTVGRMAVLQDPQGAVFSVMTYSDG